MAKTYRTQKSYTKYKLYTRKEMREALVVGFVLGLIFASVSSVLMEVL